MAIRLVDVYLPPERRERMEAIFGKGPTLGVWREWMNEGELHVQALVDARETEALVDRLTTSFTNIEGFRVVILPVEAVIPRPTPEPAAGERGEKAAGEPATADAAAKAPDRISREELYAKISESANPSRIYLTLVVLSTIVAAIGLLRDNVAVVIGAMVIAPLLGPNMALSLATTLADKELAGRALKVAGLGFATALGLAVAFGIGWPHLLGSREIASRTVVTGGDIALALASGCAGALAFTTGMSAALIGVMVAVAILPPLVTFGMLFGAGKLDPAWGALQLLLINLVSVNLAGVATFLAQGIQPRTWWEAGRARRASRRALAAWVGLLALLAVLLWLRSR